MQSSTSNVKMSSNQSNSPKSKKPKYLNIIIVTILSLIILSSFFDFLRPNCVNIEGSKKLMSIMEKQAIETIQYDEAHNCIYITLNDKGKKIYEAKIGNNKKGPHFQMAVTKDYPKNYRESFCNVKGYVNLDPYVPKWYDVTQISGSTLFNILFVLAVFAVFYFDLLGNAMGKKHISVWTKKSKTGVTFKDVKGMEATKGQLIDIVNYFRESEEYKKMGVVLPKGAILIGPPGTGKTLLAKALAGEAAVSFIGVSGSEFDEMYVGVGARRMRTLFNEARKNAPCIIFIDEIDAIGRKRTQNDQGEGGRSTLNQFLTEMDGFNSDGLVFVLGSTNLPGVLDAALTRPGRLGRKIYTNYPSIKERIATFEYYLLKINTNDGINVEKLAERTTQCSYADIEQICNEAALIAVKEGNALTGMKHLVKAIDESVGGIARKEKILKGKEKYIVAIHEIGHALTSHCTCHSDPLVRITIIPRTGAALGFAQYQPKERQIHQMSYLKDSLCVSLGGMVAEELVFGEKSTGAVGDLTEVFGMAYRMVSHYGMSKQIGPISYYDVENTGNQEFLKPYSEDTARIIDREVKRIVKEAYDRTREILSTHLDTLKEVALILEKEEELSGDRFVSLVNFPKAVSEKASIETPQEAVTDVIIDNVEVAKPKKKTKNPSKKE